MYMGEERLIQDFGGETWEKGDGRHMEDNIKMDLQEVGCGCMNDWIKVAHVRDWWQALVNEVMNLRVP